LAETALWLLPEGLALCFGAKAHVPFAGWHKITRLFKFSFSGARESLRLFELKKCGGENKKYRRVGPESFRDRLTRCPFVMWFLCPWSPVKMVYFISVLSRSFNIVVSSNTLASNYLIALKNPPLACTLLPLGARSLHHPIH
jgi:hypothetical protein